MKSMENKKIWTILLSVILFLQAAAEALTTVIVLKLNMLPGKYIAVFIALMVLLLAITALLMFVKVKGKVRTWRKIVACVLALLIVCGCALISKVASDAYRTVDKVTGSAISTNVRNTYVLVLNEDPAQSLADTKGYIYGAIANYDVTQTQHVIQVVEEQTAEQLNVTYYAQADLMVDALYAQETKALIMSGASIALLIEDENYEDFLNRVRILYTLPHENVQQPEPTEDVKEPREITKTPFVVYISGSDTRSSKLTVSRSDVNILAVVNPETKQVLLLNTPRDYFVPNPAGDGALDKLTHCGLYGTDCSMKALSDLYGVQIDYYGQINFTGFEKLIDSMGGITIYSDQSFPARDDTYINVGENYLTGSQALDLCRERYHVSGGDNGRGKNQMKVIKAVIEKMTNSTTLISNYSDILSSLEGMFTTNFTSEEISKLVKMQLSDMAKWNVQSFAVTGVGGSEKTYSAPGVNAYVMWPNENVVDYASELVQRVIAGDILTEEDMKVPE